MSARSIYEVKRSNGRTTEHETYQAALDACREEWGTEIVAEHDGDLMSGGERTLVWEDESSSVDDDGARAVASIVPAVAYETLEALRREASEAGDSRQARLCTEAMAGDVAAEARCARAIDAARAQS